jgi:large subunit ribosomal protein L25
VTHIDFLRVDPEARIEFEVPIRTEGEASLVTAEDGIAELRLTSLLVSVKPTDIPDEVVVDISEMTMDRTITVADLELPAEVDVVTPQDQVVVSAEITCGG